MLDQIEKAAQHRLDHRVAATIEVHPDKEPVRLRTNGRLKKPMGLYYSVKAGRHLPWESRNELHALWWAEVDTAIVQSWVQPHTIKFVMNGALRRYTPDREDLLDGGRTEIVEVKNSLEAANEPDYRCKLEHARSIYKSIGYGFRIVTKDELEKSPGFEAVKELQRFRGAHVSFEEIVQVKALIERGPVPLWAIADLLGGSPQGSAKVAALIAHRMIAIDLSGGLNDDTPIFMVRKHDRRPSGERQP